MMISYLAEKIRKEFTGWKLWEEIWILSAIASITGISIAAGDTPLGIASAIAGTLYTMLAGKGRISCYFFGIFNSAAYGYIACSRKIYGDAVLNWAVYLPMMFAGIIFWKRKLDDSGDVLKRGLPLAGKLIITAACFVFTVITGLILKYCGGAQPFLDAATTVLSVTAMILTLMRCAEQWLLWTAVNALSVVLWSRNVYRTGSGEATLLWWIFMLITGIIFFIQWHRAIPENDHQ